MQFEIPPEEQEPSVESPSGDELSETTFPQAEARPWGFWSTAGLGALILLVYVIVQTVVAVVYMVIYTIPRLAANPELDLMNLVSEMTSNGLLISIATILSGLAGAGLIIIFVLVRKGITFRDYLALNPLKWKTVLLILVGLAALIALAGFSSRFAGETENTDFMIKMVETSGWLPLLWIATVIFAPLFEEALFRGFLFAGFCRSFLRPAGTIVLTALIFAALHGLQYDAYGVASVLVLGLALGIVRYKSGSLWGSIMLHGLWNLAAMIETLLYVRGVV